MSRTNGTVGLGALLLASTALAGAAFAQDQGAAPPPVRSFVDQNGVDLTSRLAGDGW